MSEPIQDSALDQLFRTARSYNGFYDKPVTHDQMNAIWELVKQGPTSANCLPARIVWCESPEAKERLAKLAGGTNPDKIRKAPVTAIIGMDMDFYEHLPEHFPHADARSWFVGNDALIEKTAFRNSSLQGGYFILAARALGLDTGPMSGFDNAGVDQAFFAGSNVKSNFICMVGYGDPASIFDKLPRPPFEKFNQIA